MVIKMLLSVIKTTTIEPDPNTPTPTNTTAITTNIYYYSRRNGRINVSSLKFELGGRQYTPPKNIYILWLNIILLRRESK